MTLTANPTVPVRRADPFRGEGSLRMRREWQLLAVSLIVLATLTPLVGYFLQSVTPVKEVAFLVIVAMLYVTLSRGRLLGGSIRVHAGQFGHVHEIVEECARKLRIATPQVFVRDDPFVPVVGVGTGEPYSIIISAQWIDHLTPDEIRFLVGRELGHIGSGHTRITSLLSVNGRENALIAIVFGAWLRRIEYTADRFGLLCCESLDAALSAVAVSTFHVLGRKMNLPAFAEQYQEIRAERTLQIGEWIAGTPYATNRIAAMRAFARDPLYAYWSAEFAAAKHEPVVFSAVTIGRKNYAGFFRRLGAFAIDLVLIATVFPNNLVQVKINDNAANDAADTADAEHAVAIARKVLAPSDSATPSPAPTHAAATHAASALPVHFHGHILNPLQDASFFQNLTLLVYIILLVGIAGQTFGMMILDMRVVGTRLEPIGIGRAAWRYIVFWLTLPYGIFRVFGRIQPFEKWSGTRIVTGTTPRAS
ncbi:MAG: M48 family metalloprotease [Candidatus Velthaea sp.]|jgi:Zn-dependent protease with chaperone function/uncharacterized RDD family membrane protein YckC